MLSARSGRPRHSFARRLIVSLALVGMVGLLPSAAPPAMAQTHEQITYLLPHWFKYLSVSDAEFANEVAQLRSRLGEGAFVKVGFTVFVFVNMNVYNINTNDTAAIQAQLAGTIAEIDQVIARARANNIPVCISFLTQIRNNYDDLQLQAEAEDRRNMQWHADQSLAGGWISQSRYARKQRTVREAYIRELGKVMANRMAQFPDTVVATSGDGEVEHSFDKSLIGDPTFTEATSQLADYGPFAIAEFRDWLTNGGLYAPGQPFAGQGYALASRYAGDASPAVDTNGDGHTLNGDFGTAFTSWTLRFFDWSLAHDPLADPNAIPAAVYNAPGFNPAPDAGAGFFDPPRVQQNTNPWWIIWNFYRQVIIWRHNRDWAQWMTTSTDPATGTTIPVNRFYSDQVPADYLFGSSPTNPNFRLITSGSPHWTADVAPFGSFGITSFNIIAGATELPTLRNVAPQAAGFGRWGLFEYNVAVGGVPSATFLAQELASLVATRPSLIIPVFWDTDVPPFFIKGTPFETLLRDLVNALKDSPLPPPVVNHPATPPTPTPAAPPSAPGNLLVSAINGNSATLKWNASALVPAPTDHAPASSYLLEVSGTPGGAVFFNLNVGNTTCFQGSGPDGTYYAAMRGVASDGVTLGPRSNEVLVVLPGNAGVGGCP